MRSPSTRRHGARCERPSDHQYVPTVQDVPGCRIGADVPGVAPLAAGSALPGLWPGAGWTGAGGLINEAQQLLPILWWMRFVTRSRLRSEFPAARLCLRDLLRHWRNRGDDESCRTSRDDCLPGLRFPERSRLRSSISMTLTKEQLARLELMAPNSRHFVPT